MDQTLPVCNCPNCGELFDSATLAYTEDGSTKPTPGDSWSICFYCATILIYDGNTLRRPTLPEWQEVLADPPFHALLKQHQWLIVKWNYQNDLQNREFDPNRLPN